MSLFDFSWMAGRHVKVSYSEPSWWFFDLGESLKISVECPWRLIYSGNIKVSSDNHRQKFGLPAPIDSATSTTSFLADTVIQHVQVKEGTLDLLIDFEGDYRLEIIPISSGYESWEVEGPAGKHIVAQGGGQFAEW